MMEALNVNKSLLLIKNYLEIMFKISYIAQVQASQTATVENKGLLFYFIHKGSTVDAR